MSVPVPSLNWLRVFEAAARCESFARAAAELNMSAAAVSQQVRALEDRVGTALFVRHAHSVTLTETGRAYLPGVQQALQTLQNATEATFGDGREQQLYVQSILLFAHGVLARHHLDFKARHPDIALTFTTAIDTFEIKQGFADLNIIFSSSMMHRADGDFLLGERIYPVARPEIAAAIADPQDLLEHRLIEVTTHRSGWAFMMGHLGVPLVRARYMLADTTVMAMTLAAEGTGIALARAPVSDLMMAQAGLVPCLTGVEAEGSSAYHLVYPERSSLRRPARAFRDWLIALCEEL